MIDPATLTVDVAEGLQNYSEYKRLHGGHVQADLGKGQRRWLAKHHRQHRLGGLGHNLTLEIWGRTPGPLCRAYGEWATGQHRACRG